MHLPFCLTFYLQIFLLKHLDKGRDTCLQLFCIRSRIIRFNIRIRYVLLRRDEAFDAVSFYVICVARLKNHFNYAIYIVLVHYAV